MAVWNEYGIPTWAVLLASVLLLLYLYLDSKFGYWRRRGVKCPDLYSGFKIFCRSLTKPPNEIVMENHKTYGKVYGCYFGFKPAISIGDHNLLKQILVKDFQVFPHRFKIKSGESLIDKQISVLQGEDWKRVRSIISPTFSSSKLRKMAYLVKECAVYFSQHCEKAAEVNEEVDCKKLYSRFAIDVIAATAFGTKINSLDNPDHPFVHHAKEISGKSVPILVHIAFIIPMLNRLMKSDSSINDAQTYFKDLALHIIEERDKNNIHANDFLKLMLDAQRGKLEKSEDPTEGKEEYIQATPSNKSMSLDELLAQCIIFFRAGSDTTSSTLAFISYYLALYPEYQQKLIEEIDETSNNNEDITFDVLNKMTYLEAFIDEVLRIQPVTAVLIRTSESDYVLGETGIKIPSETTILIPIYAMHHDPEYFPDPEKFDPVRFMPENRQSILTHAYLPFGAGPRNCIGMRFAMMVLKQCIFHTLRRVRFEATEKTREPLEFLIGQPVLQAKEIWVKMVKRSDV